jgi:hypothetical protein
LALQGKQKVEVFIRFDDECDKTHKKVSAVAVKKFVSALRWS